jgi:hypothetical protein
MALKRGRRFAIQLRSWRTAVFLELVLVAPDGVKFSVYDKHTIPKEVRGNPLALRPANRFS